MTKQLLTAVFKHQVPAQNCREAFAKKKKKNIAISSKVGVCKSGYKRLRKHKSISFGTKAPILA